MTASVLVHGGDALLLSDAVTEQIDALVGDGDRDGRVEIFSGDDYEVADAVGAAMSVSMFGERVVVMRNAARFKLAELEVLIGYLENPNPTSTMVVVWEKPVSPSLTANRRPKQLTDAVKASGGEVVGVDIGQTAKLKSDWLSQQLSGSDLRFDRAAQAEIAGRLGDDLSRVTAIVRLLESVHPAGTKLTATDVAPYLGDAGDVPPWDLTDAIDAGKVGDAVSLVRRSMHAGGRHPLQVMATLTSHYVRMLQLDGRPVGSDADAAALLGIKAYPAKKVRAQAARLGSTKLARATSLLADADVDLRGRTGLPAEAVMEVLVGRLAQLSARR